MKLFELSFRARMTCAVANLFLGLVLMDMLLWLDGAQGMPWWMTPLQAAAGIWALLGVGNFAYCAERAARRRLDSSITEETPT
jgi:hypothetical protein